MSLKKINKILIFILEITVSLMPVISFAADPGMPPDKLPDMMVGQASVMQGPYTYYGGDTGNEAVLNHTNNNGQTLEGKKTPSVKFDGSNDNIQVGNHGYISKAGESSVEAWVKVPNPGKAGIIYCENAQFSIGGTPFETGVYCLYLTQSNKPIGAVWQSGGNGELWSYTYNTTYDTFRNSDTYPKLNSGEWYQLVFTFSADSNSAFPGMRMYVNGELYSSNSDNITTTNLPPTMITSSVIGHSKWFNRTASDLTASPPVYVYDDEFFNGSINRVMIYNKTLNGGEVLEHYNGTRSAAELATDSALQGFWDFNDGSGAIVTDSSIHKNVGLMENFNFTATSGWDLTDGPNIAIPDAKQDGYDLVGFEQNTLRECVGGIILGKSPLSCFKINTSNQNVRLLDSRTYIGDKPVIEISTLLYPSYTLIQGDAYLGNSDLSNFAYWGRNLSLTHGSSENSDSFWGVGGYSLDSNSQSVLSGTGTEWSDYSSKVDILKGEATDLNAASLVSASDWYLQSVDKLNFTTSNAAPDKISPDGKVWKLSGSLNIPNNKTITYHGNGTLIIGGSLTIGSNVKLIPEDGQSRLGIIAIGGVSMNSNNTIQAAVLSQGSININGSNNQMIGSFVATNFTGISTSNYNNRFSYDPALSDSWPPGFRDLKMPKAN